MSDLIRKRDAVSAISDLLMIQLQGKALPTWNEVYHVIDDIPSAEPERKTGKWRNYKDEHSCSVCDCVVIQENWDDDIQYDFCPYCGADMRGER